MIDKVLSVRHIRVYVIFIFHPHKNTISKFKHTFGQTCTATSGLAQNGTARGAQNNSLCVAEDSADVQTT